MRLYWVEASKSDVILIIRKRLVQEAYAVPGYTCSKSQISFKFENQTQKM